MGKDATKIVDDRSFEKSPSVSRRGVIAGAVAVGVVAALGGTVKAFAGENGALYPPGGQDEGYMWGACIRCGRCVGVCPTKVIAPGTLSNGVMNTRLPLMNPSECELYGVSAHCNAPCVDACEWDALFVDDKGDLVVDERRCNGCGACELACVAGAYGSYGGTGLRGINVVPWSKEEQK